MCSHVGEEEWPEIIGETVFTMLEAPRTLLATLSENQLRAKVYHRLAAVTEPPDLAGYPTARRIGDDLIAVVSVHHQRFTDTPLESSWEEFGGVDRWRELGTQNLRNLLASGAIEHDQFRLEDGSDFHMATGDARFASSVALVLDEVISRFEYVGTRTDRGVLVAVPFRHQLAWKVVDGPGAALSLNAMFQWAQMCFADSVGPLTPHVFWVRGDDWRQVTRIDDGQPRVIVEADLNEALGMRRTGPGIVRHENREGDGYVALRRLSRGAPRTTRRGRRGRARRRWSGSARPGTRRTPRPAGAPAPARSGCGQGDVLGVPPDGLPPAAHDTADRRPRRTGRGRGRRTSGRTAPPSRRTPARRARRAGGCRRCGRACGRCRRGRVSPTSAMTFGKSRLMCAFIASMKLPIPVIARSSSAWSAIAQAAGTARRRPACQSSIVSKYIRAKTASTWFSQTWSAKTPSWIARAHVLGHPQVGEREDGVVLAAVGERLEPAAHLGDGLVDAAVGAARDRCRRRTARTAPAAAAGSRRPGSRVPGSRRSARAGLARTDEDEDGGENDDAARDQAPAGVAGHEPGPTHRSPPQTSGPDHPE